MKPHLKCRRCKKLLSDHDIVDLRVCRRVLDDEAKRRCVRMNSRPSGPHWKVN
jgi:hypothetical protein